MCHCQAQRLVEITCSIRGGGGERKASAARLNSDSDSDSTRTRTKRPDRASDGTARAAAKALKTSFFFASPLASARFGNDPDAGYLLCVRRDTGQDHRRGILPVAIDAAGQVRMLLGKERYINHWRGSLKWSGFEGGRKSGEEIERTAARVYRGEHGRRPVDNKEPTIDYIVEALRQERYAARIVLCIVHGDDLDRRFHATTRSRSPTTSGTPTPSACDAALVELQTKTQQLARYQTRSRRRRCRTRAPSTTATWSWPCASSASRATASCASSLSTTRATCVHEIADIADDDCLNYTRWFALRQSCTIEIDAVDYCRHALHIERDARQLIQAAKINEDFIEKQAVQWWAADDLKAVLANGGYVQSEFFRAYFLPVLQRALQELRD